MGSGVTAYDPATGVVVWQVLEQDLPDRCVSSPIVAAGKVIVSCGSGNYVDVARIIPTFVHGEKQGVPLAAALKQVVKHARVTAESHIRTPENAAYTIASGDADLVSIVRGAAERSRFLDH